MQAGRQFAVAALVVALGPLHGQMADASAILAAARAALGGDERLSAVKTFVISGRSRQVQGDNLIPIEFEIACALPDRFLRRDEVPAKEDGPTTVGFNGDALIEGSPPASVADDAEPAARQPDTARRARLAGIKEEFARLALGMFAASFESYPLTFSLAGQAEAPQGTAHVLDVKGPEARSMRLFISSATHLPIMIAWQEPGSQPSRLYFADYRDVGGLRLPFRLRRALGPDTIEEINVDRIRVNVKIDPKRFEASR
jgi:hypothetical protein